MAVVRSIHSAWHTGKFTRCEKIDTGLHLPWVTHLTNRKLGRLKVLLSLRTPYTSKEKDIIHERKRRKEELVRVLYGFIYTC